MQRRVVNGAVKTGGMMVATLLAAGLSLGGCDGILDEQAETRFREEAGTRSITLYPALARRGEVVTYDATAAREIAAFLGERELATVTVFDAEVRIATGWGVNQARMFRDSVRHFQHYLADHPVPTDYAALPEYLLSPAGGVIGVHFYVLAADGTPAYGILTNSHHEVYQRIAPKNVTDCTRIVTDVLGRELKRSE